MDKDQELKATAEFMREWKGELESNQEQEYLDEFSRVPQSNQDVSHKSLISGIIAEGLGPLGKYTRGSSRTSS